MKRYFVITGTVTYAIKGRDLLRSKGFKAELKKTLNTAGNFGCGYGIVTVCDYGTITELFKNNEVKYLKIIEE